MKILSFIVALVALAIGVQTADAGPHVRTVFAGRTIYAGAGYRYANYVQPPVVLTTTYPAASYAPPVVVLQQPTYYAPPVILQEAPVYAAPACAPVVYSTPIYSSFSSYGYGGRGVGFRR